MKLAQFKGKLEDNWGLTFVVLVVTAILVGSLVTPSFTALADDDEEKIEVPKWNAGDRWRYSDKIPMPAAEEGPDPGDDLVLETLMDMEVTEENYDEDFEITLRGPDGQEKTYETYKVRETHNPDDPEERWEADFYYWKENLAIIHNDPEIQVPSVYHPPIVELDFPLYEGKEWSTDPGFDSHYELARFFEDPDQEDYPEPDREYAYFGRVEGRTSRDIGYETVETYMVNLTVLAYDPLTDDAQLHRYEKYYSPEVKNVVHVDIYEVRRMPEDHDLVDIEEDIREEPVGNQTLLEYDVEPYEPTEEREESLLGVGIVLVIIGVGTASFYIYKKVKSSL